MSKESFSICHVITRMIVGGAQENTLLTLRGHLDHGHQAMLVTGPSPGPEGRLLAAERIPELEVAEIPSLVRPLHPWKDLCAYGQLKRLFRRRRFDVVHTHSSKAGVLGRLAARHAGVPLVIHTVHGQAFHPYQPAWKNRLYIAAERLAARHCDRIFAVAQAMVDQCVQAGVAPRSAYDVIYSGMDMEAFVNARVEPELRDRLGIPAGVPVVGKVARLFELKGHGFLFDALPAIVDAVPDVHLLLVGDGTLRAHLEQRAAALGLSDRVIFTGLVPPADVCRYIALMDVLVHLSLREGLPRTVVQGLAGGVPVVAFRLDGTPEVLQNDETGWLCEPGDVCCVAQRVVQLLRDEAMRARMGERGRERVRTQFDWRRMVDAIEERYRSIWADKLEGRSEDRPGNSRP